MIDVNLKIAELDSLLLSCRVLGKGIEHAIIDFIVQDLKHQSVDILKSRYVHTNKNSQVKEFYEQFGFQVYDKIENNKEYTINLNSFTPPKNYNHKINIL